MTSYPTVSIPGAEPLSIDKSKLGVLLSHGFTGSPLSMRPWAEHLAEQGYSVRVPLLPGHGTKWQDLNKTQWEDWYATLERSFDELLQTCDAVAVAGLSMGGALVLRLAEQRGDQVKAIVLVNPAVNLENKALPFVKFLRWILPAIPGVAGDIKKEGVDELGYDRTPLRALHSQLHLWEDVRNNLAKVNQPLLYFRSPEDHVVDESSTSIIMNSISSENAELRLLHNSYHVATIDNDAPQIFEESTEFFAQHLGKP